jgi:predicted AlkP superfamily phosphohydrolase/phosphomutase
MRPPRTVNINAFLRTKGLLTSKSTKRNPALYLVGKSKSKLLDVVHQHELDYWLLNIASAKALKPLSKRVYMSSSSVDMEQSKAFLSAFAGPKSYSHGGVEINRRNTGGMGYEELRSLVIKELSDLREPDTNEKLITWICRREELYSGPHLSLYPDVVFELRDGYGVYWDVNAKLVGTAYEHNIAPGGHKKDAVFLISRLEGKSCARTDMTLMDVAPTILDLLGVDSRGNPDSDGSSILEG